MSVSKVATILLLTASPALADWQDQRRVSQMTGLAKAFSAACPSLEVSPAWVQRLFAVLSAEDQAGLAAHPIYAAESEKHATEFMATIADPCKAGRDFEAKLGETVFEAK